VSGSISITIACPVNRKIVQ